MPLSDMGADASPSVPYKPRSPWERLGAVMARWRNTLYASEAFQRFAVRFPLTHSTSNAYARRLFDLAVGFSYARVLHACVALGLFELLRAEPLSTQAVAARCALPLKGATTLLEAAAALELIERQGESHWRLGPLGAAMLGNPGVEAMIAHHSLLYEDLRDPIALLRGEMATTAVRAFWPYGESADPARVEAYSRLMAATQAMIARVVLAAYDVRRHRVLMDVGGGEGVFVSHALRAAPGLSGRVVDWPAVCARAQVRLAAEGLSSRAEAVGMDGRSQALPSGADAISFVRVLHDHDDEDALALLCAARAAIAPGGVVLIAEPMAGTRGAEPMGAAYFGLYLTAMGQGRPRTAQALTALARKAGFAVVREVKTAQPVLVRLLVARPAA